MRWICILGILSCSVGDSSWILLLKQRNLDFLKTCLEYVSDPDHPLYRSFLTPSLVRHVVSPPRQIRLQVSKRIQDLGGEIEDHGDWLKILSLPDSMELRRLVEHPWVEALYPVSGFSLHFEKPSPYSQEGKRSKVCFNETIIVTPEKIKQRYGIPSRFPRSSFSQGLAEFRETFSQDSLTHFWRQYGISPTDLEIPRSLCTPLPPCRQSEANLDLQYITSIAESLPTRFNNLDQGWILEWTQSVFEQGDLPRVYSISFGFGESFQCYLSGTCHELGLNNAQYIGRTNTELIKLGLCGVTILVSSGDNGALAKGTNSNCPPTSKYCPIGGCEFETSECQLLTLVSPLGPCLFPLARKGVVCMTLLKELGTSLDALLSEYFALIPHCQLSLDHDAVGNILLHSLCPCSSLPSVSLSGLWISGYRFHLSYGRPLQADYPSSSPYVTSVGATRWIHQEERVLAEIGASIETCSLITTGGGFSDILPQPEYQSQAVERYFVSSPSPPFFTFNRYGRGFPDVSIIGNRFSVVTPTDPLSLDCPCQNESRWGTSCSVPTWAGIVSLINAVLSASCQPPLGFLNPLLYLMARECPDCFGDVLYGDNSCDTSYCCIYGFQATKGWDPVGGLGYPHVRSILMYLQHREILPPWIHLDHLEQTFCSLP